MWQEVICSVFLNVKQLTRYGLGLKELRWLEVNEERPRKPTDYVGVYIIHDRSTGMDDNGQKSQSYFNDSKDAKNIWRFERLRQKGPVWSASYSNKGRRVELRNARIVQNVELESMTQSGEYGRSPL